MDTREYSAEGVWLIKDEIYVNVYVAENKYSFYISTAYCYS
jgi:hypothetical protein